MSLRTGAIEAMRAELYDVDIEWGRGTALVAANNVLDALLDYLEAHTDEWASAITYVNTAHTDTASGATPQNSPRLLIAALRGES